MAMLIDSLTINNYEITLTNCYVRVDSIYWHKSNPSKLVVLVHIWPNAAASLTATPFAQNYTLDITNETGLFNNMRQAIYMELQSTYPEFENAIEV